MGDPYSSTYLMNNGGHLYVGIRCWPSLARVEIEPSDSDEPFWVAVATREEGVTRFELFGTAQPGVRVVMNDPSRMTDGSWSGHVWRSGRDYPSYFSLEGVDGAAEFDYIPSGWVSSGVGTMTWEDYAKWPDWDFAANNSEGACN